LLIKSKVVAVILAVIVGSTVSYFVTTNYNEPSVSNVTTLTEPSLFERTTPKDAFVIKDGKKVWYKLDFDLKPEFAELYREVGVANDPQNTIVVMPIFTSSAYNPPGFYNYYRDECDSRCLTTQIEWILRSESSANTVKILNLLGYQFISDVHIDLFPENLAKYDKVILLHNEYVTKAEFDAITNHPNVVYLFPNALYAQVESDHENNTITLLQGHGYPESNISNGFDWEFDNSPLEYDQDCTDWEFYEISNGVMLNCWPDKIIHNDKELLKMIKEF